MQYSNIDVSYGSIVKRMKDELQNSPNRIEGSFAMDNIQAVGRELEDTYGYINWLSEMHFLDTAENIFLDSKASEYGVERKLGQRATGNILITGNEGTVIKSETTFTSDGGLVFLLIEEVTIGGDKEVLGKIIAKDIGRVYNLPEGLELKPMEGISIDKAIIQESISNGYDIEDDEALRDRTYFKIRYPATSGNVYHYMHWALDIIGVGRVKVYPLWKGPGTVKISIINSNYEKASDELISIVKNAIDPDDGKGTELAPIGAYLTVTTATEKYIDLSINFDAKDNYSKEFVVSDIKENINKYFREISYVESLISYAKIIDIVWNVDGVARVIDIYINDSKDNIELLDEEIPILNSIGVIR